MDSTQRGTLAFVLTLVGGIFGVAMGLLMGAMGFFMGAMFNYAAANPKPGQGPLPPIGIFYALFGWFAIAALAGGITMLVCAPRLRHPMTASRGAAIGAIVGGGICMPAGNVVAAGLGIAGGVIALTAPQQQWAAGGPAA